MNKSYLSVLASNPEYSADVEARKILLAELQEIFVANHGSYAPGDALKIKTISRIDERLENAARVLGLTEDARVRKLEEALGGNER